MAKKNAARLSTGSVVRVKPETAMPEFESLSIGGWEGTVLELQGKGPSQSVILEWSPNSLALMSEEYKQHCESQGLFCGMACLPISCLEIDGQSP